MLRAYILIEAVVGTGPKVVASLRAVRGVTMAERVTGPYDVIAEVEAIGEEGLGELLEDHVRRVPGITKTLTCLVVTGRRQ